MLTSPCAYTPPSLDAAGAFTRHRANYGRRIRPDSLYLDAEHIPLCTLRRGWIAGLVTCGHVDLCRVRRRAVVELFAAVRIFQRDHEMLFVGIGIAPRNAEGRRTADIYRCWDTGDKYIPLLPRLDFVHFRPTTP